MEIHLSVRQLVEFILREGSIDNRHATGKTLQTMQEGGRIHRMIQKRMGADYHAEVPLKYIYHTESYDIYIEGRADGIIDGREDKDSVIDEIKGTYRELKKIKEPVAVHLAQAKCYAYIYASQNNRTSIGVRMTYCNMDTEELKYFHQSYCYKELEKWFLELCKEYEKWADFQYEWEILRTQSIKELQFPYEYREGQKKLATYVYQTIYHGRKLFLEAPTGVGKTLSTVFPTVKSMGERLTKKIFYLTAKTIARTVAEDCFMLLRKQNLKIKTVTVTAKEKICFMEETECNPAHCPYADGHFDRINEAMYDLLIHEDNFARETIEEYAKKHQVCPFEMCLDMSLFSDVVICDYNYVFDPNAHLKRFFGDNVKEDYTFLIDEAHNLVERARGMFSAILIKEDFLNLKKIIKEKVTDIHQTGILKKMEKQLQKCNQELLVLKRNCENYKREEMIANFVNCLTRLFGTMDEYLDGNDESPIRKDILEFFFEISHFLNMYEIMDENYISYTQLMVDGRFGLKLFCVNPANNLAERMEKGRSTILFSATLLPIQYYKKLLGGRENDYEVYAPSTFQEEKKALYIASDVTTKYSKRNEQGYKRIAKYILQIISQRSGNYMIFFPSYVFMQNVYDAFLELKMYPEYRDGKTIQEILENGTEEIECIIQDEYMKEEDREHFLAKFLKEKNESQKEDTMQKFEQEGIKWLVGFCIMGGIFSEGIDLKNDSLIGAIIVGTGLPQVGNERELLKEYFDEQGENGFDYAYKLPGMNKVLQSAGRVIRTAEDVGVVALLDERFMQYQYQKNFPREWNQYKIVTVDNIGDEVEKFWNEWL